jgi:hypothetical protein
MTSLRSDDLIRALPYARRYARALAGNQLQGDALVADSLKRIPLILRRALRCTARSRASSRPPQRRPTPR